MSLPTYSGPLIFTAPVPPFVIVKLKTVSVPEFSLDITAGTWTYDVPTTLANEHEDRINRVITEKSVLFGSILSVVIESIFI